MPNRKNSNDMVRHGNSITSKLIMHTSRDKNHE